MKIYLKRIVFGVVFFAVFGFNLVVPQAELIEPSRSLKTASGGPGHLTVFSEPPGLDVKLDGASIGSAPIRVKALEPGIHRLQVGDSVTDIYIEPGQTFHISLFRNRFIKFEVAQQEAAASPDTNELSAVEQLGSEASPQQYKRKEENRKAWERWMQFVNGSSRHF